MPVELKSLLTTLPNSVNIIIAHVGTSDTTWQQSNMTKSDFSTLVDSGILRVFICVIFDPILNVVPSSFLFLFFTLTTADKFVIANRN